MTIEKMCFIAPEDIESVQFKCAKCSGSITVPVSKLGTGDIGLVITRVCPHCRTESGFTHGASDLDHFMNFALVLGRLTEIFKGKNVQFSFQVKCPEK